MNTPKLDWNLFDFQEEEINTINNELYDLRKQKYPEYRDSYYRYYNEFGMLGMIGDLYRKFDRLKIMSESYSDEDIRNKEKEITDQFYDIISYCQLQLYWLRKEKWEKVKNLHAHTFSWNNTGSGSLKTYTNKDGISVVYVPAQSVIPNNVVRHDTKIFDIGPCVGFTIKSDGTKIYEINVRKLAELVLDLEE